MTNRNEIDLEQEALRIPVDARLRLAAKLLASVPRSTHSDLSDEQALDLAERRAGELDSGEVSGLDYREEMKRIRDR